jgi:CheY-like chemotaxis protein
VLQGGIAVDLVLTDVRMPGALDGLELARRIRATWPRLKVIMVSGDLHAMPADGSVDMFFAKPYSPAYVSGVVKKLLAIGNEQP